VGRWWDSNPQSSDYRPNAILLRHYSKGKSCRVNGSRRAKGGKGRRKTSHTFVLKSRLRKGKSVIQNSAQNKTHQKLFHISILVLGPTISNQILTGHWFIISSRDVFLKILIEGQKINTNAEYICVISSLSG